MLYDKNLMLITGDEVITKLMGLSSIIRMGECGSVGTFPNTTVRVLPELTRNYTEQWKPNLSTNAFYTTTAHCLLCDMCHTVKEHYEHLLGDSPSGRCHCSSTI